MRTFIVVGLVALACLLPTGSFAQVEGGKLVLLRIPDSQKDTEIHLAKVLLERLKINATLQSPKGKPEDVILRAGFKPVEEKGLPAIIVLIDTKIVRRDDDGTPTAQVISITSFADIEVKRDKRAEILDWANKLNSQSVPLRVYVAGTKLGVGRNLLNATQFPLAENAVTDAFTRVYRAWPSILMDMKKNGFIDS